MLHFMTLTKTSWILPLGNPLSKPDLPVDDTFREKVRTALKPLDSLAFNDQEESYYFSDDCKCFRVIPCHYKSRHWLINILYRELSVS